MLATWGPVGPAPEPPPSESAAAPAIAPAAPAPVVTPARAAVRPAIIAKAPIDVRARPALVAAPNQRREPLHKQWAFWVIAGSALAAAIVATVIATRPPPDPYRGNAAPYYMWWP